MLFSSLKAYVIIIPIEETTTIKNTINITIRFLFSFILQNTSTIILIITKHNKKNYTKR